jgi:arylsulfatase A
VQKPWVPTPYDPGYAAWNPAVDDDTKADTAYFPGMVAYMDKTIGRLVTKVKNAAFYKGPVIIFISDNATNGVIGQSLRAKL